MEDAKAESGEGALLNGVVCFRGQTVGEEGRDGEVKKDFAGDFRGKSSEGHLELNDRSCYDVGKEENVRMYASGKTRSLVVNSVYKERPLYLYLCTQPSLPTDEKRKETPSIRHHPSI